jgi:hypothetical protein
MMDTERMLTDLSRAAAGDRPPLVDVVGGVLADLPRARTGNVRLVQVFSVISSVAALVTLAAAVWLTQSWQDPFGDFLQGMMAAM